MTELDPRPIPAALPPPELAALADALAAADPQAQAATIDLAFARLPGPPGLSPAERMSRLGRALLRLDRPAEAEAVFRQAVAADPASVPALKGLGRCLNRRRAWPEALEVWRDLIDLAPGWPEARRQTVRLLCRLGRDGEAGELVAEAILSGRLTPAAVADLLEACGLARPAEGVLRRSLPVSRAQLVGLLIRDGRIGEALALDPDGLHRLPRWRAVASGLLAYGIAAPFPVRGAEPADDLLLPERLVDTLEELRPAPVALRPGTVTKVTSTLGPGGAERQLVLTAEGLHDGSGGFDVDVVCLAAGRPDARFFQDRLERRRIAVHEILPRTAALDRLRTAGYGYVLPALELMPAELSRVVTGLLPHLAARRPSLVHGWQDMAGLTAALAAGLVGLPTTVVATRSLAPDRKFVRNRRYLRPLMRELALRGRIRLLNNSRAGAEDYARWLDIDPALIRIVHNGLETEALVAEAAAAPLDRAAVGLPADGPVVGGVLRLSEEKRPALWLDAARRIAEERPDAAFLLTGDGPLRHLVAAAAAEPPLRGRLVWLPRREDVAALYRLMDVLLLTSRLEGLPNVVIEAQALGVPVVAPDAGGCAEALDPGRSGLLVRPADAAEFAAAVGMLLDRPALRRAFAGHAPGFVEERFSLDRMIRETVEVYREAGPDRPPQ